VVNTLKRIEHFLPRHSLLVLYRTYIVPFLDCGDILHDNCSIADTNLLESVQTSAAKLVLGGFRTTSRENILNNLGLTPLNHTFPIIHRPFLLMHSYPHVKPGLCMIRFSQRLRNHWPLHLYKVLVNLTCSLTRQEMSGIYTVVTLT